MAPAFVTTFLGAALARPATSPHSAPRCAMGDSIAPVITIKDTRSDQTSNVTVTFSPIAPNDADAIAVTANAALAVSLRSATNSPSLPSAPAPSPSPGVSPADHYFPPGVRDKAPVISLEYNKSVSVSYDPINPAVSGVVANKSTAFWKQPVYKYDAPAPGPEAPRPDIVSASRFEKHYPSRIRNHAPFISMKAPAGPWDDSGYLQVGSDVVALGTVEKEFGDRMHIAPDIQIVPGAEGVEPSVTFGMAEVPEPVELAEELLSEKS